MNLRKLYLTKNHCYIKGGKFKPIGIMWHSTGANNPNLKRYVGPDDGLLGYNKNNNHWNTYHPGGRLVCVHAFIGLLEDGTVATYQTLPWDMPAWHCGGSGNNKYIGFEICEDGLNDKSYFDKVYKEAVELSAFLCKLYNLDPKGKNVIICHADGAKLGIASNHGDIYHWFKKYGKTMEDVRNDVAKLMGAVKEEVAEEYSDEMYRVRKSWADAKTQKGAYRNLDNAEDCADVNPGYKVFNSSGKCVYDPDSGDVPFKVRVEIKNLYIRKGPGTNYKKVGYIKPGVYTIVDQENGKGSTAGWGKLKSGAGWISLDYAKRV